MTGQVVQGSVAQGFEEVREEFGAFVAEERADYAAQLVAYRGGERVVDLWVGPEFTGDSLVGVYSCSKGAAHLVVALLVQEGVLELDQKVSHYWPEFAAEGKAGITLRELLSHRAGLIGVDGGFTPEELADDQVIAARLAGQRPFWRPGAAFGYHALVIAALTGEVVRRVTGQTIQQIFEERVRAPYGLDFYLGLPEEHEPRVLDVQPMLPTAEQRALLEAGASGPHSLRGIAFGTNGPAPVELDTFVNSRAVRAAGSASAAGVGSARGLAKMYAAAISEVDGRAPLLKPDTAAEFAQVHSAGEDLVLGKPNAFGLGFSAVSTAFPFLGARAFGHSGAAGSQAFADPASGLAYGYVRRRFTFPGGSAPENLRFAAAVHRAL